MPANRLGRPAEYPLPPSIEAELSSLADRLMSCQRDEDRPIGSHAFISLPSGELLVFLTIPDYLCHLSATMLPLTVSMDGHFATGPALEGAPNLFGLSPEGSVWLAAQTQVEASTPILYASRDGKTWTEIQLPPWPSDWAPFVFVERFCFSGDRLYITLKEEAGEDETRAVHYSTDAKAPLSAEPSWQPESGMAPAGLQHCTDPAQESPKWGRAEDLNRGMAVFFTPGARVLIPTRINSD